MKPHDHPVEDYNSDGPDENSDVDVDDDDDDIDYDVDDDDDDDVIYPDDYRLADNSDDQDEERFVDEEELPSAQNKKSEKKKKNTKGKKEEDDFVCIDGKQIYVVKPILKPYKYRVTSEWVVPTNFVLLLILDCHVNVEACGCVRCVKYIFKYIYKGGDCANLIMIQRDGQNVMNYDEIQHRIGEIYFHVFVSSKLIDI